MLSRAVGTSIVAVLCITAWLYVPWIQNRICASIPNGLLFSVCSESRTQSWNLFYHLGGNGPWIQRAPEGKEDLPLKCEVDQVHMLSRHAERYPTTNAGTRHLSLLNRVKAKDVKLSDGLAFAKDWEYFTNVSDPAFEELTNQGPYAGTVEAFESGQKLRKRYGHLLDPNRTTEFWSCGSQRDIDTAVYFGNGFFGADWNITGRANLQIIPETLDRGGDTLTPGDTCRAYRDDPVHGHDKGYAELAAWQDVFTKPIAKRLSHAAGGISFTPLEVYSMMEMCGFEILARGSSPWCHVFTHEEWLDFEYGRDLLHFYRAGPGNTFAGAMGWLWLNATTSLLTDPAAGGVYLSFVHDGDIIPLLATLGIFDERRNAGFLPNHQRRDGRKWKTSDITPMGGRLVFERVTCSNTGLGGNLSRSYVRLFINDGIVDLERSIIGSGLSNGVGMRQWDEMVQAKGRNFGNFREVCTLPDEAPDKITFLRPQYI